VSLETNNKDSKNGKSSLKPFMPQTEDQLLERIDRSLAQTDAGMYIDTDEVSDEMLGELLSDSLIGVLKNDYDDRVIRDERIERI
jgi:hypothetical protein